MSNRNHGELSPRIRDRKKPAIVPRVLQGKMLRYNIPHKEAVATFGLWQLRALTSLGIAGHNVEAGDLFETDGANAVFMVAAGTAEFTDKRIAKEAEVLRAAQEMGLDKPVKIAELEQFQPRKKWEISPAV